LKVTLLYVVFQSAQRRIRSMVVAAGGSGGRTPRGPRQDPQ
jgi:hypothetical protein